MTKPKTFGLVLNQSLNSYVSTFALLCMMYLFCFGSIRLGLYQNELKLKKNLLLLNKQSFVEAMIIQHVKYQIESMEYDESTIYYDDVIISFNYDFQEAKVTYQFPKYTLIRYYQYDLSTKTIDFMSNYDDDSYFQEE